MILSYYNGDQGGYSFSPWNVSDGHFTLACMYAGFVECIPDNGSYWYTQEQKGHELSDAAKFFADQHATRLSCVQNQKHHLGKAGELGNMDALLVLAESFGDPSIFKCRHLHHNYPASIAVVAEEMGRDADAKYWFTVAADQGDAYAMRELIDKDECSLFDSWKWIYLSKLVGEDLTLDKYYAVHEDGSDYDDGKGGALYAGGYGGVSINSLNAELDAAAKLAAQKLYKKNWL